MINKQLVASRFSRVVESYNREAVAQKRIACRMNDMLVHFLPNKPKRVLEIGSGTGFLTRQLTQAWQPEHLVLNDICAEMRTCYTDLLDSHRTVFMAGDAERLSFPGNQDLIVSCSVLQWFVSPDEFVGRCKALLAEKGYLAFTTFGCDNLKEVTSVTGNGLRYRSLEEWKRVLQLHYEVISVSEEHIRLTFDTPLQVLYHLKHTGVTAVSRQTWTRRDLQEFCDKYAQLFGDGNAVALTYHPIYMIAKKKQISDSEK